ncbi:hypothetical protein, partial [Pseudoalteromonas sp. J010]|uniref:hypothetical protein n=1 Tax=Pseudoalteromonas sp. J010 TaxID=998465 RepID=UPI0023B9BE90
PYGDEDGEIKDRRVNLLLHCIFRYKKTDLRRLVYLFILPLEGNNRRRTYFVGSEPPTALASVWRWVTVRLKIAG